MRISPLAWTLCSAAIHLLLPSTSAFPHAQATTESVNEFALISINDQTNRIPLGERFIPTDIIPPPHVTSAKVTGGPLGTGVIHIPLGFGCFFSKRGEAVLGTFTSSRPIPRRPLPPFENSPPRPWPDIIGADMLTCFQLPFSKDEYLVWVLYADGVTGGDYDPDQGNGIEAGNEDQPASNSWNGSPREELIRVHGGLHFSSFAFEREGRLIEKALLIDGPYRSSSCLFMLPDTEPVSEQRILFDYVLIGMSGGVPVMGIQCWPGT